MRGRRRESLGAGHVVALKLLGTLTEIFLDRLPLRPLIEEGLQRVVDLNLLFDVLKPKLQLGLKLRSHRFAHIVAGDERYEIATAEQNRSVVLSVASCSPHPLADPGPDPLVQRLFGTQGLKQEPLLGVHTDRKPMKNHQSTRLIGQIHTVITVRQDQHRDIGLSECREVLSNVLL